MHEILTLQFGQQANYVGTHYWNTQVGGLRSHVHLLLAFSLQSIALTAGQESYFTYAGESDSPVNHDVSFRSGIGADGSDTYTPRTLIYDLKGAFGTLRKENALYELQHPPDAIQQAPWSTAATSIQLTEIPQSPYQRALDAGLELPRLTTETVRFWSDFNHVYYHPRSIVQLSEYELNSSLIPFERWQTGDELFLSLDREHDLLDRDLRPFLEECDQIQAIQVFAGTDDAWGGFASRYLERITDDIGKCCRWVFGLQDPHRTTRERQVLQAFNTAQCFYAFDQSSSLHIPTSNAPANIPAYLRFQKDSRWHTSAFQCAGIESITLPARLRSTDSARTTFENMEAVLNGNGKRRIAACSFSVSSKERSDQTNGNTNSRVANGLANGYHDLTEGEAKPGYDVKLFPEIPLSPPGRRVGRRIHTFSNLKVVRDRENDSSDSATDIHQSQIRNDENLRTSTHPLDLLFPVLTSYPHIFRFAGSAKQLNIEASLSTSTATADYLRNVENSARRLVGIEEREALCDGLAVMAEEYNEGWMSEDDSDDD